MSLETDQAFYEKIKPDLLADAAMAGQFALIKDGELVDVYPTYQAAYDAGVAKFGTSQVFIKEILVEDRVETI